MTTIGLATEPPHFNPLCYAAGLFDGEGSITLTTRKGKTTKKLCVSLTSTDVGLTNFMKEHFGGGVYDVGVRSAKQKRIYHWMLIGTAAIAFLRNIRGLLREARKRRRADIVVDELANFYAIPGRTTEHERSMRTMIENKILAV